MRLRSKVEVDGGVENHAHFLKRALDLAEKGEAKVAGADGKSRVVKVFHRV